MQSSVLLVLNVSSNSALSRMEMTIILVDKTKLEENYVYYIDFGTETTSAKGGPVVSTFNPASFNYFNYILGLCEFRVDKSTDINFFRWTNGTYLSFSTFKHLAYYATHWRMRQCINSSLAGKFIIEMQICSTTCPAGYNTTATIDYCVKCHYTCSECNKISSECT